MITTALIVTFFSFPSIKFNNEEINLSSSITIGNLSRDYAEALQVENLFLIRANCTSIEANKITTILDMQTQSNFNTQQGDLVLLWLFTIPEQDLMDISIQNVYGYLKIVQTEFGIFQVFSKKKKKATS